MDRETLGLIKLAVFVALLLAFVIFAIEHNVADAGTIIAAPLHNGDTWWVMDTERPELGGRWTFVSETDTVSLAALDLGVVTVPASPITITLDLIASQLHLANWTSIMQPPWPQFEAWSDTTERWVEFIQTTATQRITIHVHVEELP